jgi:hypothetical protein
MMNNDDYLDLDFTENPSGVQMDRREFLGDL